MGALMTSETVPDCPKVAGFNDVVISDRYGSEDPQDVPYRRLHDAIINNDVEQCRIILRHNTIGQNPQAVDVWINRPRFGGRFARTAPPLHLACMHRRPEIVKLLLENGSNPYSWDNFGRCAMALLLEYWPRISMRWEAKEGSRDQMEFRTRVVQQHQRSFGCLKHLLNAGVDVTAVADSRHAHTVLHLCAKYDIAEPVNSLLEKGADLEKKDSEGRSPLLYAASVAHARAYHELLTCGADVNVADYCQRQALHYLCDNANNNANLITQTIQLGAQIDSRDFMGDTPLHRAAKNGSPEQIRALLMHGADPEALNNRGRSPVFHILHRSEKLIVSGFLPLLMMSHAIKFVDDTGEIPNLLRRRGFNDLHTRLLDLKSPPTLQRCCIVGIRRTIGIERCEIEAVNCLPLPKILQDAVLGSEELCFLATSIHPMLLHETHSVSLRTPR